MLKVPVHDGNTRRVEESPPMPTNAEPLHKPRPRVLLVDDDRCELEAIHASLAPDNAVTALGRSEQALRYIDGGSFFDVAVLAPLEMSRLHGLALAERLKEAAPETSIVMLAREPDLDVVIQALHVGAFDLVRTQPFDAGRLEGAVAEGARRSRLAHEQALAAHRRARDLRLLDALDQVATASAQAPALDVLVARIGDAARGLCQAECARVLLFERGHMPGSVIVTRTAGAEADRLRGRHADVADALMTRVADTCQALRLDRAEDHPRHSPVFDVLPTHRAGFLCAPLRRGHVLGAVAVAGATDRPFGPDDLGALVRLAGQAAVGLEGVEFGERVTNFVTHTAELLFSILDRVDAGLTGHSRATARLADMLTRRLGLPDDERRATHFAALLHDVDKLGALSGQRRSQDGADPSWALELLRPVAWWHESLAPVALHRHPWDGRGRPGQAAGSDLPLSARVLAVACEFDHALRRAGRDGWGAHEHALRTLQEAAGSRLDPRLVRLFCAEYRVQAHEIQPDTRPPDDGVPDAERLRDASLLALAGMGIYAS